VLSEVAGTIRRNIRGSDVFARLGGDEFAILLPECGDGAAPAILARIRERLSEAMAANGWPVTLSIGALTYASAPESYDQLLRETDGLMYEVKSEGKDGFRHRLASRISPDG
jgi:diguanylate cyclase (GGDEF)-like protein